MMIPHPISRSLPIVQITGRAGYQKIKTLSRRLPLIRNGFVSYMARFVYKKTNTQDMIRELISG
jgi:hypothetical protein